MKIRFILSVLLLLSILTYSQNSEVNCEIARKKYLVQNPDVAAARMDAWVHYNGYGRSEGRKWPNCEVTVDDNSKTVVESEPSIDGISNCEINGKIFFSNAIKYVGQCKNNKANGWGTLELTNGDRLSGFFTDNKLQDNFINYYYAKGKKTTFGPNINSALNGPCIGISNDNYHVSEANYDNGAYRGNSDLFEVSSPEFTLNEKFCQAWGYFAKIKSIRIPNTNKIIFNSEREYNNHGDKKIWITIVNLETNKIVLNFGSFENPISTLTNDKPGEPNFIGFSKNNDYAYYNIKRSIYDKDSFLSLNLNNGIKKIVTQLPYELTNNNKNFLIKEKIDEINFQNLTEIGSKVLNDSSYIKVYNFKKEKALIENSENAIQSFGSLIIHFGKDNYINLKKSIDNVAVEDFDINENIKKIALSYKGIDSTYLSYFDLDSFSKIADVFVKSNTDFETLRDKFPGDVKFSKSGAYLVYSRAFGSCIFSGTELFFGFTGGFYGFNKNENCILTNSTGTLKAYSLEQKRLLWQYNIGDNKVNTGFFNVDNDFVIISGRMNYSSQGKPINGMKFYKFKMPEAIFVRSDFKIKSDEIETNKPIVESKQILPKNKSKKNDVDDDNWLMKAFIWGINEAEKNPKPYSYTPNNSSSNAQSKIYSGTGTSYGKQIGYMDGQKFYSGTGTSYGTQIGYIDSVKIYSGTGTSYGTQIGYIDGTKIYSGTGTSYGKQVGYIDGVKIYSGTGTSYGTQIGYIEGGRSVTAGAAFLLLY